MKRKSINTTLNVDLYAQIQRLASKISYEKNTKIYANDLIEEGMRLILEREGEKDQP